MPGAVAAEARRSLLKLSFVGIRSMLTKISDSNKPSRRSFLFVSSS
jgi:hypothetical protein